MKRKEPRSEPVWQDVKDTWAGLTLGWKAAYALFGACAFGVSVYLTSGLTFAAGILFFLWLCLREGFE